MSENASGLGSGILRGLKKILFTEEEGAEPVQNNVPPPNPAPASFAPPPAAPVPPVSSFTGPQPPPPAHTPPVGDAHKEMKLKVYQLLENMNRQGVDFFEVWNAATEMGGVTPANIKAAFTSLRYADKSLDKTKLLESGEYYKTTLQKTIDAETVKREEEKATLNREKEQSAHSLVAEIQSIEQQIQTLQEKLANKKNEQNTLNEKYEPRISAIDSRINVGRQTVSEVIAEMQQVLDLIQREVS